MTGNLNVPLVNDGDALGYDCRGEVHAFTKLMNHDQISIGGQFDIWRNLGEFLDRSIL